LTSCGQAPERLDYWHSGAPDVMTDCLPGSILPDDLRKCGYGVTAAGDSLGYAVDPLALLNLRSTG